MQDNLNDKIILFDGVCNLCNGVVQFIIKNDDKGIFKFASLQSDFGQQILSKNNLPTSDFNSFVLIENGTFFLKSTAALKVLKNLGGKWTFFYFFIVFPKFIRDFFYDLIAKRRYSIWGKNESCMMPTPELRNRFLD
ncbi:MAG: thiol-disulfide oxidoreductase DCC family protein [Bacteroidetes bacterium]|nr:thiol-disulfide oxidoreductase DCC family protein [Bacteroidota bacterium]